MRAMKASILLLLLIAGALGFEDKDHLKPSGFVHVQHSLRQPYLASGMVMPFWDFIGNAVISDDFIRLTPDRQSKRGALWNSKPTKVEEWEVTLKFHVHGQGKNLFGDGFAFWYTQEKNMLGDVFGSKDHFHGLAVFFDTYSNQQIHHRRGAYVSAMINDGTIDYDHDADGTHQELASCSASLRNKEQDTYARISYRKNTLKVELDTEGDDKWTMCFFAADVYLPPGYYFGLSAATGDLADNHDIIWVQTADPAPLTEEEEELVKSQEKMGGSQGFDEGDEKFKEAAKKKSPFARFHERARKHIGKEARRHVDYEKKEPILTRLNRDHVKEQPSTWYLWLLLAVALVGGIGGVIYKVQVLDKKNAQKFNF
eukprot:TRINITY_DN6578_c0_g1_i2.p1 TRINITY_DN6578_c0_g1~~TRINITY_DN6578_c0_g1_i2.p1  ORF type:complete len:370 (+),score=101.47 TRINITY_DN6578_c0_g1_i2:67-1176(+)